MSKVGFPISLSNFRLKVQQWLQRSLYHSTAIQYRAKRSRNSMHFRQNLLKTANFIDILRIVGLLQTQTENVNGLCKTLKELLLVNEKQRPFSRRKISFQTLFPLFLLPLQQCLYKNELRFFWPPISPNNIPIQTHFGLFGAWVKQVQTETSYILLSMIQLGMYPNVNIIIPPTISTQRHTVTSINQEQLWFLNEQDTSIL